MLSAILAIFTSGSFGSILGWIGGLANKIVDIQVKKLEFADAEKARAHDAIMKNIDVAIMEKELAGKERIASIEKDTKIEIAAYDALAESYKHDESLKGAAWVESLRASIRPLVTMFFFFAAIAQVATIFYVSFAALKFEFSVAQIYTLLEYSVQWLFFQAGVCIGWWFATRTSAATPTLGKRNG